MHSIHKGCLFYLIIVSDLTRFTCRVLTPYYTEDVLFSLRDLEVPNEDGVSILFYLQKIFPGLFYAPVNCLTMSERLNFCAISVSRV